MTPGEYRLRFRFRKTGRLRWLSHLEVLRAVERMIRRSGIPYAVTQGFNPHMKIAFGPALPVGTASESEYADVWLTRYTDAQEVLSALIGASPTGISPAGAAYVGEKDASLGAALTIAMYRIELKGDALDSTAVHGALQDVLKSGRLNVENRGKTKVFDLARSVPKDVRTEDVEGGIEIELAVRIGPEGSLRPEALLQAALTSAGIEVSSVHTTRLDLLQESEEGVWSRPV